MEKFIKETLSVCPEDINERLKAQLFVDGEGRVMIRKTCPNHGTFDDVYWSDYGEFLRFERYARDGRGLENPRTKEVKGCPYDCGICPNHKSQTVLAIIDVTNRCNLRCPICFANAGASGYVYEPSREEICKIIDNLRANRPLPPNSLQFSGGEPTIRDDLPDLIRYAKAAGFRHIEVNTNGIRAAKSPDYVKTLKEAGMGTFYLSFDGVTREPYVKGKGADLLDLKLKAVNNSREAGVDSVVLVPTISRGLNDDQLGAILKYAVQNSDVVKCVNFQPVSICGRFTPEERLGMRITIPECLAKIEEQTGGQLRREDFFPIPTVVPISKAVGALRGRDYVEFTNHFACGAATFFFVEDGRMVPITRYANIDKFIEKMDGVYELAKDGHMTRAKLAVLLASLRYARSIVKPLLGGVLSQGSYDALKEMIKRMVMVGMMHFMDPYNFDLDRCQRCDIHYGLPDGRIIPFCPYNTIHRPIVEKEFAKPLREQGEETPLLLPASSEGVRA